MQLSVYLSKEASTLWTDKPFVRAALGYIYNNTHINGIKVVGTPTNGQVPSYNSGSNTIVWVTGGGGGISSVTSADATTATVANPTTTPVITIVAAPKWKTARLLAGNSVDGSADVAFTNKFIAQGTTDSGLTNAQFLGALTTGLVKNTTTTGVLSIATAGTDYLTTLTGDVTSSGNATTYNNVVPYAKGGSNASTAWTQGSILFAGASALQQDNDNIYWNSTSHIFSVATAGDQSGTDSVNTYGQIDHYQTNSAQGTVNSLTMPGTSTSTSRGTGASPTINNANDIVGNDAFWGYTNVSGSPAYVNMCGVVGILTGSGGTNGLGGELDFYVKADNATTYQKALQILNTGHYVMEGVTTTGATGTGNIVFSASPAFTGSPIVPTQATSDNSTKIASTAYVTTAISNAIAAVNSAMAVQYATTLSSETSGLTYANGVSGIGATMTGANNTVTTIDGHAFVVGDVNLKRVLIKNDTQSPNGAFNGIYLFTALHTSITGDIFTRALDYDQPSDINNTGAIPVVNGTANADTSWLLTSSVTTMGTDPLTYVSFSVAPSTIITNSTSAGGDLGGTYPNPTVSKAAKLTTARTINNVSFDGSASILLDTPVEDVTTSTYTFAAADDQKLKRFNSSSAQTATVPLNVTIPIPVGAQIDLIQIGAGTLSLAASGGVTINSFNNGLSPIAAHVGLSLKKVATDTWELLGAVSTVGTVTSIAVDSTLSGGPITTTGTLGVNLGATNNWTAAINEAKGTNITSASTTNIGAATGNYVNITGTTTITAFDTVQAGTARTLNFNGVLTLTNNNTSLILPGGANITTVAGDIAIFRSLGSGNWVCTTYTRSSVTGTGSEVLATSPTLVTPTLGAATATTINKYTLTTPATGATLAIADGKTATVSNTLTFTGTDGSSVNFGAGGTMERVLACSGNLTATVNSSTETNAAVITVPAGVMNANGRLQTLVMVKCVGTTDFKTLKLRVSTTSGDTSGGSIIYNSSSTGILAASLFFKIDVQMFNANSTTNQFCQPTGVSSYGANGGAGVNPALNTANVFYININTSTNNSADTIQVTAYSCTLLNP